MLALLGVAVVDEDACRRGVVVIQHCGVEDGDLCVRRELESGFDGRLVH